MPFALEVVTPEAALWSGPATAVMLATSEGNLTVLDGHTPLIGDVVPGEVRIEPAEGDMVHLAVHGGFVQVDTRPGAADGVDGAEETSGPIPGLSTRVTVLAGIAELASEIDVDRAQQARESAEARLVELRGAAGRGVAAEGGEEVGGADLEVIEAEGRLARAELRLAVAAGARSSSSA